MPRLFVVLFGPSLLSACSEAAFNGGAANWPCSESHHIDCLRPALAMP